MVPEIKVVRTAERWCDRGNGTVQLVGSVGDFGEYDLPGQHDAVEQGGRAVLEILLAGRFELVRHQPAVGAHRIHEQLGISLLDYRGHSQIQERHERCMNHEHDARHPHPQGVGQSLHSSRITRTLELCATSRSHMKVTALGSLYSASRARETEVTSTGRSRPCRFTPIRICRS